jgi:hypothetical protein
MRMRWGARVDLGAAHPLHERIGADLGGQPTHRGHALGDGARRKTLRGDALTHYGRICKGELRHGYREGMEDQLGALGLILNTITLWNTVYLDHALEQLRASGIPGARRRRRSGCRRSCAATSTSTGTTRSRRPSLAARGGRYAIPMSPRTADGAPLASAAAGNSPFPGRVDLGSVPGAVAMHGG